MLKPNIRVRVLPRLVSQNGEAATIAIGSVQTVSNASEAAVINVGTGRAASGLTGAENTLRSVGELGNLAQ